MSYHPTPAGQRAYLMGLEAIAGPVISLRAHSNGKLVTADAAVNQTNPPLRANRTAIGPWEKFTLVDNDDGRVSLQSGHTGKYVAAQEGNTASLVASQNEITPSATFDLNNN
ncbi:fascin domain-containing protein [Streptomyces olivochromogenes]|uniref:fascin domain-containing protein n=1 Tax=Streptomyces olivochromogenes TaxID=1963 RepID=UPI001F330E5C|nr:hypothetical protein [Streptomyces olivochromogenes]MCF3133156.1 hypothetical protein [Streptomyces olivochromogenes]